ncbi:MAG: 30S ribosomal protein S20 [Bdellovibrionaceae bacterium]|nr:30S ribosomal protein S20 [Pseudobdellovibrionaceae bacterium]
MANHKSAAKRARQDIKKSATNAKTRSQVRTFEKKLLKAIASEDSATAKTLLVGFSSKMGKAAQKGVFHANTAARKISRLATQVSRLG